MAFSPFAADAAPSGELLCRNDDLGKKIPFVNSHMLIVAGRPVMKFPKFDN
jgi:hypothetical protein